MAERLNTVATGAHEKAQGATSDILGSIEGWGDWIAAWGKGMLDKIFPPEKRAAFLSKLQSFMLSNPKLSVSGRMQVCVRAARAVAHIHHPHCFAKTKMLTLPYRPSLA